MGTGGRNLANEVKSFRDSEQDRVHRMLSGQDVCWLLISGFILWMNSDSRIFISEGLLAFVRMF